MLYRTFGTTRAGTSFDAFTRLAVWQRAYPVAGYDPAVVRKDACGAWIRFGDYGRTDSEYGWEVDHVCPVASGGLDVLENLQPLHWKNNRHKGDSWPHWGCAVRAA